MGKPAAARCFGIALLAANLGAGTGAQELPALVALTIDTSGSISSETLQQIKGLAAGVLQALPPASQVAVFSFNDTSAVVLERTADIEAVQQAVQGLERAGRYTALYDALYDASRYLKEAPPARKAIILVTDGLDENSSVQVEDGLKLAVEGKIPVYCVGVGRIQESVLRRIAKLTAGDYATLGESSPAALAERIAALPAPEPPPPPAVAVPLPVAPPPAPDYTWLYVVVGSLVVAASLGAAYFLRRRPAPARSPAFDDDDDGPEPEDAADSTVVMRTPDSGPVERTVMIRLQPSLVITRGVGQGQVFNLSSESSLSIGRAPTSDIVIVDSAVSGQHCRVRPEGGAYVVHDLESTNGTFVNDRRVKRHRLSEGDVIRVGETLVQFKMGPG